VAYGFAATCRPENSHQFHFRMLLLICVYFGNVRFTTFENTPDIMAAAAVHVGS
jgi:hypothetical protein